MTGLLERHLHLALGAETGDARFRTGGLRSLAAARADAAARRGLPGPEGLVEVLLAPLAPEIYQEQRRRGLSPHQITPSLTWLSRLLDT